MERKTPTVEEVKKATRRKAGRPLGSKNKNDEYKRRKREREKGIKLAWETGYLKHIIQNDSQQLELRDMYYNHGDYTNLPWLLARQSGKSYLVCTLINEEARRKPGITMAYIAPKLNQAKKIVNAKMREILQDCPKELRPKFNSQENKWTWDNGSELYLAGTDNGNAESIRGMTLNRVFVDEFCFLSDFEYVMNSIIFPTMLSVDDPLMVLISSPPKTADHESNKLLDDAESEGRLVIRTVYDCPRHSETKIRNIIKNQYYGDPKCVGFRREYMCERIADTSKLVLPEAAAPGKIAEIVQERERPEYYTRIEGFDWGFADRNAGLLSYVNYDSQILYIEDEMWLDKQKYNTKEIVFEIRKAEMETWGFSDDKMITRWGDNNDPQLLWDMQTMYDLYISPTQKQGLQAAIGHVRDLIKFNQIIIHPRCVNLIEQIQSVSWVNSDRKKFSKKTKTTYSHHYDLVAALIYLVRNANLEVNPYPVDYDTRGLEPGTFMKRNPRKSISSNAQVLADVFTIKKKRR